MNKRQIGTDYEEKAVEYLRKQGYSIFVRNFRNRVGEIDIIAKKDEYLCFIEVKYRKNKAYGFPAEAVNFKKQQNIRRVAEYYLMKNGYDEWTPCRFDVIAIEGEEITLIQNAFGV